MRRPSGFAATALVGLVVIATATTVTTVTTASAAQPAPDDGGSARQQAYAVAAREHRVPASVLLGVSYLESRWDTNGGAPSTSGGFGAMHLTDSTLREHAGHGDHGHGDHGHGETDRRGDDSRPAIVAQPAEESEHEGRYTLDRAAELTGVPRQTLRADPVANLRGGAAVLVDYQKALGGPLSDDPAQWYGAVAHYSGASERTAAAAFADEVFDTIRTGATRTTDDGHVVRLPAHPGLRPQRGWLDRLALRETVRPDGVECPASLSCEWIPSPYQQLSDDVTNYGNHDRADRPGSQRIEYIVIHDTEGSYATTVMLAQRASRPASWNYTIRSADGHIAQHIKAKDVAWHAGNWFHNAKAVGIEHEGFMAQGGSWYTEAMYRSSAKLVRHLAFRFGIPLDRQHIIGHDNVPGRTPDRVPGMHVDPGPYWDWAHYFELMHAPLRASGFPRSGLVMIHPDYDANRPAYTGCDSASPAARCPEHGSSAVTLYREPRFDAPLARDIGKHPPAGTSTMSVYDHGARASTGQIFAVAERRADWTAVWYLGQKAWFHNPARARTARDAVGLVVTPKRGRATVPVYGRAYPEAAAYPPGVTPEPLVPLQYTFSAGERYAVGMLSASEYYRAKSFDNSLPADHTVIRGRMRYVQIQFGHRIAYVNVDDVQILPSPVGAP